MKKLIFVLALLILPGLNVFSQIEFGVLGGLSTPNDEINNVYNSDKINWEDGFTNIFRDGTKSGYHIGARARLGMKDGFDFVAGLTYHKFPMTLLNLKVPGIDSTEATLQTTQNIVSISTGLNYYLWEAAISMYLLGDLQYNYISNNIEQIDGAVLNLPSLSPSNSRVGFGFGAGLELDLKVVSGVLEAKYHIANLIGKESGEESKNYLTLSLGVFIF